MTLVYACARVILMDASGLAELPIRKLSRNASSDSRALQFLFAPTAQSMRGAVLVRRRQMRVFSQKH